MSKVKLAGLVKRFGKTVAVDKVSLEVESGHMVVLLGPSGCGKTTTLRCIAGLETADEGDIFIDDVRTNDLPPKDRDIAMVFQNYALYPHMSIFDNIAFSLRVRKHKKEDIANEVKQTAKMLNIEHLLTRKPRQLSGGEQQRVALARAIVRHPRVFLMDEPLSNLDAKLRLYTRAELKKLQHELKITTIYVTHDQAEAMSMADEVAIMNNGKLIQYEEPFSIYDKPATTFVAGFIGSPPMNLLNASLVRDAHNLTVDAGAFKYPLAGSLAEGVNGYDGSEVVLGVRPEDIMLLTDRTQGSAFEAEVYVVEPLGSNTIVDIKADSAILKSNIQGKAELQVGTKTWVSFRPDKIRIFAKDGVLIA